MPKENKRTESLPAGNIEISADQLIDDRFRIGRRLGAGNFGEIRVAHEVSTKTLYAVKLESANNQNRQLFLENKYYKMLHSKKKEEGIPDVYFYGITGKYYALVMDLLGPSLEELFENAERKFTVKTITQIAIQTIRRVQTVHSYNIVYRDIKPENFLIGGNHNEQNLIYLVDFGLSKEYIDPQTKRHIPYREHKSLTGTARYMSINTHLGREQSRRDDLESLGHMFFYFLRGHLPWQGLKADSIKERYTKIGEVKRSTPIEVLCENCPIEFGNYLRYARQLDFYQEPDYDYLVKIFETLLNEVNTNNDNIMDWMNSSNLNKKIAENAQENENYSKNPKTKGKKHANRVSNNQQGVNQDNNMLNKNGNANMKKKKKKVRFFSCCI